MKARVKIIQKQLTNQYKNNHVVYLEVIMHEGNKMINKQAHKMCA